MKIIVKPGQCVRGIEAKGKEAGPGTVIDCDDADGSALVASGACDVYDEPAPTVRVQTVKKGGKKTDADDL